LSHADASPPTWALGLAEPPVLHHAKDLFGTAPAARRAATPPPGRLGHERLRELGPLVVDGVDLAPHLLRHCLSNCSSASAFTMFDIPNPLITVVALCGSSASNVYAVARRDQNVAVLWQWNGTQWTQVSNNLGMSTPRACYLRPDGALFITGLKDVVRWEQGAAMLETAGLDLTPLMGDQNMQTWWGIAGVGNTMVAVGLKRRSIVRDSVTQTWSLGANPATVNNTFNAIAFAWPDEAYAAGTKGPQLLYLTDGGTTFTGTSIDLPAINSVNRILALSPDELYFGGGDLGSPVLVRGKR
jgi:hypothetical protein